MYSFELAAKIRRLLDHLGSLTFWTVVQEWGTVWDDNRPSFLLWLETNDLNRGPISEVKAKVAELLKKMKLPTSKSIHNDTRTLRESLEAFYYFENHESEKPTAILTRSLERIERFEALYDKMLKDQNGVQAALLSEEASRLSWWFRDFSDQMVLFADLLDPLRPEEDGTATMALQFSEVLDLAEIADILVRLNRLYANMCEVFQSPETTLRVKKIETGSFAAVVYGIAAAIGLIQFLIVHFRPGWTAATKLDNDRDRLAYFSEVKSKILEMKSESFDVTEAMEILGRKAALIVEDVSAIKSKNPSVWKGGVWTQQDSVGLNRRFPKPPDQKQLPE